MKISKKSQPGPTEQAFKVTINAGPEYLRIGQAWPSEGGAFGAHMPGENGAPDYFLIYATDPRGNNPNVSFGGHGIDEPGAKSDLDGEANTKALVASTASHPAAEWAASLEIDGVKGWSLPSKRELRALAATVPHAIPPGWYQTCTQSSANNAWFTVFPNGDQDYGRKDDNYRALAVRRVPAI